MWFKPSFAPCLGFVLSSLCLIAVPTATRLHYLHYLTAHHNNTLETQQKWRGAFAPDQLRFNPNLIKPARDDLSAAEQGQFNKAVGAFAAYHGKMLAVVSTIVVMGTGLPLVSAFYVKTLLIAVPIALLFLFQVTSPGYYRRTWIALLTLLHSPEERAPDLGVDPNWSAKSPIGTNGERQHFLWLSLWCFVQVQTPLLFERLLSLRHPHPLEGKYPYELMLSLYESFLRGEFSLLVMTASAALTAMYLSASLFLLGIHLIGGGTFHHAHKILDNDSP
jgi:hypothetical protein